MAAYDTSPELLELIARASQLDPGARETLLQQSLGDDPARLAQARRLLTLVEQSTVAPDEDLATDGLQGLPRIPGFELIELIGHGGMGSVFRARQQQPEREVAIKLIRADLISQAARHRLTKEANLLARLDHPGIARVFAAGHTTDSLVEQPWLAMELIEGLDLGQWLRERQPEQATILRLFERLAAAVHYAHQQGIIHRDLKPSNILVDASDQPHVLDFGVADFTELDPIQASTLLAPGELVGTLGYMAPEQLEGKVDTRSDVYALGVMLYQALGHALPMELSSLSLLEALNRVAREQPRPLRKLRPDLPPDLEALVMHALARDPARRYASADALREDLYRFRAHRPLLVRPPGHWRGAWLFIRRHRLAASMLAIVFVSVVAGAATAVHFGLREAKARAEAETRSAQLLAVNRFLGDMLTAADPDNTLGERVSVVDALNEAARMLPLDEGLDPAVRAELHRQIGFTLVNMGRTDEGATQLELALDGYAALGRVDQDEVRLARLMLARARLERGRIEDALMLAGAVEQEVQSLPSGSPARIDAAIYLGRALLEAGRDGEAEELVSARLAEAEVSLGADHPETLVLANLLASIAGRRGNYLREGELQRLIHDRRRERFGPSHPQTLSAMNNLAKALADQGELDEAENLLREALASRERVLGLEHPSTVITRNNLAALLIRSGRLSEAEPLAVAVLDWNLDRLGPHHPNTLMARNILGYLLEDLGQIDAAEQMYRSILVELDAQDDDGLRIQLLAVANNLAMLQLGQDRLVEASATFEALLEQSERLLGPDHFNHQLFSANHGWCLHRLGRSAEAVERMRTSLVVIEPLLGREHPRVTQIRDRLAAAEAAVAASSAGSQ